MAGFNWVWLVLLEEYEGKLRWSEWLGVEDDDDVDNDMSGEERMWFRIGVIWVFNKINNVDFEWVKYGT